MPVRGVDALPLNWSSYSVLQCEEITPSGFVNPVCVCVCSLPHGGMFAHCVWP